jgi:hypothetical protein
MKHLLTGVAMAAALAIAAPVWAQTAPMTPSSPPKAAPAPAATTPMAKKPMAKMPMKKHTAMHHHRGMTSEGDQMTEQLNQQELSRLQGGNTSAMPAPAAGTPAPGMGAPPPPK